jgi:hypothetical protein
MCWWHRRQRPRKISHDSSGISSQAPNEPAQPSQVDRPVSTDTPVGQRVCIAPEKLPAITPAVPVRSHSRSGDVGNGMIGRHSAKQGFAG